MNEPRTDRAAELRDRVAELEHLMALTLRQMRIAAERAARRKDPTFVVHPVEEA